MKCRVVCVDVGLVHRGAFEKWIRVESEIKIGLIFTFMHTVFVFLDSLLFVLKYWCFPVIHPELKHPEYSDHRPSIRPATKFTLSNK